MISIQGIAVNDNPVASPSLGNTDLVKLTRTVTGDPVITNAQAQAWCKSDDDFTDLIEEATNEAEQVTQLALRDATITAVYKSVGRVVTLPVKDVVSVTSVLDKDDNAIDTDDYTVTGGVIEFVLPRNEKTTITYTASCSHPLKKLAIRKLVLSHYEDRQNMAIGVNVTRMKNSTYDILQPLMRY